MKISHSLLVLAGCDTITTTSIEVTAHSSLPSADITATLLEVGAISAEHRWVGSLDGALLYEYNKCSEPFRIDIVTHDDGSTVIRMFNAGLGWPRPETEKCVLDEMHRFYALLDCRLPSLPDLETAKVTTAAKK